LAKFAKALKKRLHGIPRALPLASAHQRDQGINTKIKAIVRMA